MKFLLSTITEPKLKLYYVEGNKFTADVKEAYKFESREEALIVQDRFLEMGLITNIDPYQVSENDGPSCKNEVGPGV